MNYIQPHSCIVVSQLLLMLVYTHIKIKINIFLHIKNLQKGTLLTHADTIEKLFDIWSSNKLMEFSHLLNSYKCFILCLSSLILLQKKIEFHQQNWWHSTEFCRIHTQTCVCVRVKQILYPNEEKSFYLHKYLFFKIIFSCQCT